MWRDRVSYANSLCQCQNPLANILYRRRVFSLHRYKTIGNHRPQQEGNTRTLREIWSLVTADVFLPIDRAQLVSAPKISFGNGTTTSSTVVDNWLILMCCGAWAPCAHRARPPTAATLNFKCLLNRIIGSFEC